MNFFFGQVLARLLLIFLHNGEIVKTRCVLRAVQITRFSVFPYKGAPRVKMGPIFGKHQPSEPPNFHSFQDTKVIFISKVPSKYINLLKNIFTFENIFYNIVFQRGF